MTKTLAVEHNGTTYAGQLASIESTSLGYEDHGILTAWIFCTFPSGGIGVGGYCLDQPRDRDGRDYTRVGTAYGLDHLMRLMETVGVDRWEKLPGQQVIVLFDAEPGVSALGKRSVGLAGVLNDHVLILAEHAEAWRTEVDA